MIDDPTNVTTVRRDWVGDEDDAPGVWQELKRLGRRARRRWFRTLVYTLVCSALVVGAAARKPRSYASRVAFRVTEGELESKSAPKTIGRLRDYVATVIFSSSHLVAVIKEHNLYPSLMARDPSLAVESMRDDVDVEVWRNEFAVKTSEDDPARSARVAITFHSNDAQKTFAVVTHLAKLIRESEQHSRVAQAEPALRLVDDQVEQARQPSRSASTRRRTKQWRPPVRPARGNYYEGGATKSIYGSLRIDANLFRRDFHNFPDDDTLLYTGISFPSLPSLARIFLAKNSASKSPSGGLWLPELRQSSGRWQRPHHRRIVSGQRRGWRAVGHHPVHCFAGSAQHPARTSQVPAERRVWFALSSEYGSGLPVELGDDTDMNFLLAQYGAAILNRVNFDRQRVRPNFSLDAAAGAQLYRKALLSAAFQIQVSNLTDRLNVLNFASLFSGTAVAAPRSVSASLKLAF